MNNFEYSNPVKVYFGEGVIENLGEKVKTLGKKCLIVSYDNISFMTELFDTIRQQLSSQGIGWCEYLSITANPTINQCREGIDCCKANDCDFIIGVGGGSVMDAAKIIAAGSLYPYEDIRKMVSFSHSDDSNQILPKEALPTLMIPTLPATGSEMNPTAVVTDEELGKKSYLYSPDCLYPKIALVDPSLGRTLPLYQTACGAFDTIAHVLESYFNGDEKGELALQDQMQLGVIKAVYETLPRVAKDPNNSQLRGVMQWASAIALNGWLSSGTYGWAPMHQMAHVISARYHVTHGATLAIMILGWMRFFAKREDNTRYKKFSYEMFGENINEGVKLLEAEMIKYGVQTRLEDFGIKESDLEEMVEDVVNISFGNHNYLESNPNITKEDVLGIYKDCL